MTFTDESVKCFSSYAIFGKGDPFSPEVIHVASIGHRYRMLAIPQLFVRVYKKLYKDRDKPRLIDLLGH
jgi:hypothetical protein